VNAELEKIHARAPSALIRDRDERSACRRALINYVQVIYMFPGTCDRQPRVFSLSLSLFLSLSLGIIEFGMHINTADLVF